MPTRTLLGAAHPSTLRIGKGSPPSASARRGPGNEIPAEGNTAALKIDGKTVALSNLAKIFWPEDHITKRDLLRYYTGVSSFLLPHIKGRAMVMKRYPDGADGQFFFQKHAPSSQPEWIPVCEIQHPSANLVDFPVVDDLAALL